MKSHTFQLVIVTAVLAYVALMFLLVTILRMKFGSGYKLPSPFGYLNLGVLAAVLGICYYDGAMTPDPYEEIIRGQFHLPDEIALGRFQRTAKQPVCWLDAVFYKAEIKFTVEQFARYTESLDDSRRWDTINRKHFGDEARFSVADGALRWVELPEPPSLGSQQAVWRIAGSDVRHGKAQCFQVVPSRGPHVYSVRPCEARQDTETPEGGALVVAALDYDNKALNVRFDFRRKAAYCENRAMNALNRALGIEPPPDESARSSR